MVRLNPKEFDSLNPRAGIAPTVVGPPAWPSRLAPGLALGCHETNQTLLELPNRLEGDVTLSEPGDEVNPAHDVPAEEAVGVMGFVHGINKVDETLVVGICDRRIGRHCVPRVGCESQLPISRRSCQPPEMKRPPKGPLL